MKVFRAEWETMCCGEYEGECCTIVATTESEALGLALMAFTDTRAEWWTLAQIDTTKSGVHIDD